MQYLFDGGGFLPDTMKAISAVNIYTLNKLDIDQVSGYNSLD